MVGIGDDSTRRVAESFGATVRISANEQSIEIIEGIGDGNAIGIGHGNGPVEDVISCQALRAVIVADGGQQIEIVVSEIAVAGAIAGFGGAAEGVEPIGHIVAVRTVNVGAVALVIVGK